VATSDSVGSNPVTHTSANVISISTTSAFSGSIEITCTHNTESTVTATYSIPLSITGGGGASITSEPSTSGIYCEVDGDQTPEES
jgi:hypothetical protein